MKIEQPSVHLDHMLRQTRNHHVQLSSMADLKANILLTLSSVVITISFTYISNPDLKWGALILIGFCFLTIILSIYTVMPKIPVYSKSGNKPDINNSSFNFLFFGDFSHLDYEYYEKTMEEILNDTSRMYQSQIREIYNLGKFLAQKKYRFIRLAYLSFILGLFLSCIIMLISSALM